MKILAWGAAVGAVAALVACGGGGGNTGGGDTGGNGTTTMTTTSVSSSSGSTNTTTSTGTGTGGAGPTCGIYWEDPTDPANAGREACETCMEDSCCTELGNCAGGTDCAAWVTCVSADNCDSACVDACNTSHQQGYTDYQALLDCYSGSNFNGCKYTDCTYPICDSMVSYADEKCATCLSSQGTCCADFTACAGDQACGTCINNPKTAGCDTNTLYQAIQTCESNTCGHDCETSICGSPLGYPGFASCNYCLSQQCCTSFDACTADMNSTCYKCLTTSGATGCDTDANYKAFTMCRDVTCKTDCGG